jgi:hypothetical protein
MTTFSVDDYSYTALQIGSGVGSNESLEFFEYQSMKSIGKAFHNDGDWYVIINFFVNDVLNPLKINLSLVNNQPTWTNDIVGADQAVSDIQSWMSVNPVTSNSTIVSPLGIQPSCSDAVSVALCQTQYKRDVTPVILFESGANGNIGDPIYSISFASNGTADASISFDGGSNYVALPAGTTINMDAAGLGNMYPGDLFYWDTSTNAGSSLIITYNF